METFRRPGVLSFDGKVAQNWSRWKQRFELFLEATKASEEDDKVKVSMLLNLAGEEAIEIYNTFGITEADRKLDEVLKRFDDYCAPKKSVILDRSKFFAAVQEEGESFEKFLTRLKRLASPCEFGDLNESMIVQRIISGIRNDGLRERLLRENKVDLKKASEYCRAAEISRAEAHQLSQTEKKNVDSLKTGHQKQLFNKDQQPKRKFLYPSAIQKLGKECQYCGYKHEKGKCPAFNKTCNNCKRLNHFAKVCKSKKIKTIVEEDKQQEEVFVVSCLHSKPDDGMWDEDVLVEGKKVSLKLDSGSMVNVLPQRILQSLSTMKKVEKRNVSLIAFGNSKVQGVGKVILSVKCKNREAQIPFIVVNADVEAILGKEWSEKLNLISRVDQISELKSKESVLMEFKDIFSGIGKVNSVYKIELDPTVTPVIHPARGVPVVLQEKLRVTLEKLVEDGIVEKVVKPTTWVNSLVIVEKPNKLRLCLDPKDLNKAIKRQYYLMPTVDDILSNLSGRTVFSVLDMKDGFWHIPLHEESTDLCTFNTPFGRFKFLRMPFGISSAPEVFQRVNMELFGDIEGVQVVADDIIIAGKDEADHDRILRIVLERARKENVRFNPIKFQFRVPQVKFLGHVLTGDGLKVDPQRVTAISEMERPTTKTGVRKVLGMVNFLGRFIPAMSKVTAPLRVLLENNTAMQWNPEQELCFQNLKKLICSAPVLAFFNPKEPIIVQTDASQDGLGACLLQNGHPVVFASRSLTAAERNYAQIEKELLGIVFATKKFHSYIYGHRVVVQTDHKPLVSIANKNIHRISSRLQRMELELLRYDLEITYVPGKHLYIADLLSRSYLKTTEEPEEEPMVIHSLAPTLAVSDHWLTKIKDATKDDNTAQLILKFVKSGWPKSDSKIDPKMKAIFTHRESTVEADGLIFVKEKLYVPGSLRREILLQIHTGHLGVKKCIERAKDRFFWPGMTKDIELFVRSCVTCLKHSQANRREPMMLRNVPGRPWEMLAIDFMDFGGNEFLVIIDYFSKWIHVEQTSGKTASDAAKALVRVFSIHGVPDKIMSDNMPFGSLEFRNFAKEWNFEIITSSPHYPQSNGLAESAVKTSKSLLRKNGLEKLDEALLEYRNSPVAGTNYSPSEMLMSRRLKSKLITFHDDLKPQIATEAKEQLEVQQRATKAAYDSGAQKLKPLRIKAKVLVRENNGWKEGVVVRKAKEPRSYFVKLSNGQTVRRNRKHLKEITTLIQHEPIYDDDVDLGPPQKVLTEPSRVPVPVRNSRPGLRPREILRPPQRYIQGA